MTLKFKFRLRLKRGKTGRYYVVWEQRLPDGKAVAHLSPIEIREKPKEP